MHRAPLVALLLAAVAAAQGVDDWIDTALDERTAPVPRVEALKKVAQSKDGLDKLAERGLDARRDPEVVHAVVETLLAAPDYRPYLARICRLLLSEKHREKVLQRFQQAWEENRGQWLFEAAVALARDADPQLREAAILALGKIPRRLAVVTIVETGLAATEEPVRAAAHRYVQVWLGVATLKDADDLLKRRKLDSFYDLVEERIRALDAERAGHERAYARFMAKANATDALDEIEQGGPYRLYPAQRLAKLAEVNGIQDKVEFARRSFDAIVAELSRDPPDAAVLTQLLAAVQPFARDASGALWRSRKPEDVRDTIQRIARVPGSATDLQALGSLAVKLLGSVDDKGLALFSFAEKFPSVEVRKEAIQQLGLLASRVSERSHHVGIQLTNLLQVSEKEPSIRAHVLNLLTQPHIPVVTQPNEVAVVRGYLEGKASDLTDGELRDCALILRKAATPEAREGLLNAAAGHPKLQARRYALEEGLVPWARSDESIHAELAKLALDSGQTLDLRKVVVEALGRRGGRRAAKTLQEVEDAKELDPLLKPAIRDAQLQLIKRLANGEGAAADAPDQKPADLDAAVRLLDQEIATGEPDAERLEPLASLVVGKCDLAKAPAGSARYWVAWLYGRLPADRVKEPELLKRYDEAAANAVADKLPAERRRTMLVEYRDILAKEPAVAERMEAAATCDEELGELSESRETAAAHYLDAAERHLSLGNRPRAKELLDKAVAAGGVAGDLAERERQLRAKAG